MRAGLGNQLLLPLFRALSAVLPDLALHRDTIRPAFLQHRRTLLHCQLAAHKQRLAPSMPGLPKAFPCVQTKMLKL